MESEARSGRLSTSRNKEVIEKVCQIMIDDCHLILREIVEEVGISRGSLHSISTEDLCMWRVLAEFIPKLLMEQQKNKFLAAAEGQVCRRKKARQVCSNVKVMLTCFFDSHSIVHQEYAPEGQTINEEYYLEILHHLHDAV